MRVIISLFGFVSNNYLGTWSNSSMLEPHTVLPNIYLAKMSSAEQNVSFDFPGNVRHEPLSTVMFLHGYKRLTWTVFIPLEEFSISAAAESQEGAH